MAKKTIDIRKDRSGGGGSLYDNTLELKPDFGQFEEQVSGIVQVDEGVLGVKNIQIHRTGLQFVGIVSEEEYEIFGQTLLQIETAYQWIVGDYLAYGADNGYGRGVEIAEQLGKSSQTVWNWVSVARYVEYYRRQEVLSFTHHEAVAGLSPDEQTLWLKEAIKGNDKKGDAHQMWSASRLRKEIAKAKGEVLPEAVSEPAHIKLSDRMSSDVVHALTRYRNAKTDKEKIIWRNILQKQSDYLQQVLEQITSDKFIPNRNLG